MALLGADSVGDGERPLWWESRTDGGPAPGLSRSARWIYRPIARGRPVVYALAPQESEAAPIPTRSGRQIPDHSGIGERPPVVDEKVRVENWEVDLIVSSKPRASDLRWRNARPRFGAGPAAGQTNRYGQAGDGAAVAAVPGARTYDHGR